MGNLKLILINSVVCASILINLRSANGQCSGTAYFTVSSPTCVNQSITFTNQSSSSTNATSYYWVWSDGSSNTSVSSITSTTHTYTTAKTYVVWLFRVGSSCKDSVSNTIIINPTTKPKADFTFNNDSSCAGTLINFTNKSSGNSLAYLWDFGDTSTTSTSQNPTHQFTSYGTSFTTFRVNLTVTDYNGCSTDTISKVVTVKKVAEPILDDTTTFGIGNGEFRRCNGTNSTIPFKIGIQNNTDKTLATGYKISWGDGTPDTSISTVAFYNTTHTYTAFGVYTLTFTVYTKGCSVTKTYKVINESNPSVGILSPGSTTGCVPATFTFKLNATNVSSSTNFTWDFGDGTPTITWDYTKKQDSITHTFNKTSCGNKPAGASCTNCFSVKVIAANNCGATQASVDDIVVYSKPKAAFTAPAIGCVNTNVGFNNTTSEDSCAGTTSYKWIVFPPAGVTITSSSSKSPNIKFTKQGTYSVTLIARNNGCGPDTITKTIEIDSTPVSNFSHTINPASGCTPLVVDFTDSSAGKNKVFGWVVSPATGWSFTDSTSSTSTNPEITFTTPGTYTVTQTVSNTCGNTSKSVVILVTGPPMVILNPIPDNCGSYTINPSATFNNEGSAITSYKWTFTGGIPANSTSKNPGSITYSTPGTYTVSVFATNSCGNSSTVSQSFKVNPFPKAKNAGDQTICSGVTVSIGAASLPGSSYFWSSNPLGFSSNSSNPGVTPTITTSYYLTETITATGCKKTDTLKITVNPIPVVDPGKNDNICISSPPFAFSGYRPSGGTWSGKGVSSSGTFSPAAAGVGTFTLTYSYTDSVTHCSNSASKTVTVNPLPTVNAGKNDTFCNSSIPDTLTGFSPMGGTWSGKGVSSIGVFTPSVAGVGIDTLTYSYTDVNGCPNASQKLILVTSPSTVNAGPNDTVCVNTANFSLKNFSPGGGVWSGIGVTSAGIFSPSTAGAGIYTLIYTYGTGTCKASSTKIVKVNALPTVNAGSDEVICINSPAYSLSGYSPKGGTWSGTGVSSTGTFSPATAGAGTVTLTYSYVDPTTNCSNSAIKNITINPLPFVDAGKNDTFCNSTISVTLSGYSPSGGTWSGKGVTTNGIFTPSVAGVGIDTLTYTYTDVNGCTNSSQKEILVTSPTTIVAGPNDTVCIDASDYTLKNFSPSGGIWSGTGVTVNGVFSPAVSGTGSFMLTYTYGVGTCKASATKIVNVNPLPVVTAGKNEIICLNTPPYPLSGQSPKGGKWTGKGVNSTGTFTPSVAGVGTDTLTYVYTDSVTHCSSLSTKTITINPLPTVYAGKNDSFCNASTTITLSGYSPSGGTWSGKGVTSSGVFTPSVAGVGIDTLTYSFTDINGCTNTSQKEMIISNPATIVPGNNDTVCIDAGNFTLKNFSPAGGTWSGTGVTMAGIFSPTISGTGTFTLTYTYGAGTCKTSATKIVKVNPLPTVNAGNNEVICFNTPVYSLSGQSPSGGTWSGTGVSAPGNFNPAIAGVGTVTLTYSYTDPKTRCSNLATKTITINPLPVISSGPADTFCNSNITATLSGSPNGGYWTGKGVTAGGVFTPSKTGSGIFNLYYHYTIPSTGCSDSAKHIVNVIDPAKVIAGPNDTLCISAPNYTFSGFSPPGGVWSGPGVSQSGSFSPATSGPGTYTLTYTYGKNTCLVSASKVVIINPLPNVNAGNPRRLCYSEPPFALTGYSPSGGIWSGDGITDNIKGNYDGKIAGVGSHLLTYSFTDPKTKCSNFDTVRITILPMPDHSIKTDTFECVGIGANFSSQSTNTATYAWYFGDSSFGNGSNLQHAYYNIGKFNIRLISTTIDGCSDTIYSKIRISQPPFANFTRTPYSGPGPLTVGFKNLSSGQILGYKWNYGNNDSTTKQDPDTIIYKQSDNGDTTYYITLTVNNVCGISMHKDSVLVFPRPKARFGTDKDAGCSPFKVFFSNKSVGKPTSYFWDFGNGQTSFLKDPPPMIYTAIKVNKTYVITEIVKNPYGSDTFRHIITVHPDTLKSFFNTDITSGCAPLAVQFTDFTKGVMFVTWDFGDGNVSDIPNPSHIFTKPGIYTVKEYVNDGCGFDTGFVQITVHSTPIVSWKAIPTCASDSMQFINTSPDVAGCLWDFGDGTQSILVSPKHVYSKVGNYNVTLSIQSNKYGCSASASDTVNVDALPSANFTLTPLQGCRPLDVKFTSISSNASYYKWDFGDGNTSVDPNPEHFYQDSGAYNVKFSIVTKYGCTNYVNKQVIVFPYPVAKFNISPNPLCGAPKTINFSNVSKGATGYFWKFSNGKTSIDNSPSILFDNTGNYTATLLAVNSFGCKDSTSQTFTIFPQPVAGFDVGSTGCQSTNVQFKNQSSYMQRFTWDFGDGTTDSTNTNPSHSYLNPGKYIVSLHIAGEGNCEDQIIKQDVIQIHPRPTADFTFHADENPSTGWVDFKADTTHAVSFKWYFGDNDSSTLADPRHHYELPGDYTVKLIVENGYGCFDMEEKLITIKFFGSLFVPNALSPGSGPYQEQIFLPKGTSLATYKLQIYTTWGELLWENTQLNEGHPSIGWDGTSKGKIMPQGVYVWKITATFINGDVWLGKDNNGEPKDIGSVTLIR